MSDGFDDNFNFRSPDWGLMRAKLISDLDRSLGMLSALDCLPNKADQLRGRVGYIKDLLASETTAHNRVAR